MDRPHILNIYYTSISEIPRLLKFDLNSENPVSFLWHEGLIYPNLIIFFLSSSMTANYTLNSEYINLSSNRNLQLLWKYPNSKLYIKLYCVQTRWWKYLYISIQIIKHFHKYPNLILTIATVRQGKRRMQKVSDYEIEWWREGLVLFFPFQTCAHSMNSTTSADLHTHMLSYFKENFSWLTSLLSHT